MEQNKIIDRSEQEDNAASSVPVQALEYYKKYSLNSELPKYFSGIPNFQITDWNGTRDDVHIQPALKSTSSYMCTTDSSDNPKIMLNDEDDTVVPASRASSVASNRKLEWDNGADIGYNNAIAHRTLQKSISLPVLNKSEYKKLQDTLLDQSNSFKIQPPFKGGSTSSESYTFDVDEKVIVDSGSSSSNAAVQDQSNLLVTSTTSSLLQPPLSSESESAAIIGESSTFIKKKIGVPIANSTPFALPKREKDVEDNPSVFVDINTIDKETDYKHFKMLTLTTSKAVVVECVDNMNKRKSAKNKLIQTSLAKLVSVSAQTDFPLDAHKVVDPKQSEHQSIFYMYHSDSDAEPNINNSSVQTDSDIFSNYCQSFEFLHGDDLQNRNRSEWGKLQRCSPKSDITSLPVSYQELTTSSLSHASDNPNSLSDSPLGQLLSSSESVHRIPDFYNKVRLLQKMLKSHKYTNSTKKFYLKEMLKKMFETQYLDDTNFVETGVPNTEEQLQQNKPWVPVQNRNLPVQNRNLQVQTFINEIVPDPTPHFVPIQSSRLVRSHVLTLKSPEPILSHSPNTEASPVSLNRVPSASEVSSNKTWRNDKTISEQRLETDGSGDSVNQKPVKAIFEDDIEWINKEIVHLNKLKKRLREKKSENIIQTVLDKPQKDFKEHKQATTVYVMTTETCRNCRCLKCKNHQCVIKHNLERPTTAVSTQKPYHNCTCQAAPTNKQSQFIKSTSVTPPLSLRAKTIAEFLSQNDHIKNSSLTEAELSSNKGFKSTIKQELIKEQNNEIPLHKDSAVLAPIPSTSKSSDHSSFDKIPLDFAVEKNQPNCKCGIERPKRQLVQQLVSVESIEDNNGIQKFYSQSSNHCQCAFSTVSVNNNKINLGTEHQEATCSQSAQCVVDTEAVFAQGYIKEKSSNNGNKASRIIENNLPSAEPLLEENYLHCQNRRAKQEKISYQTQSVTSTESCSEKQNVRDNYGMSVRNVIIEPDLKKKDQNTQTSMIEKHFTCTSSSSSSTHISSSSTCTSELYKFGNKNKCACCKRQVKIVSVPETNPKYILCHPCYTQNGQTPYFTYPGNVCKCHLHATQILHEVRDTVKELNMLEKSYCNCRHSIKQKGSDYCVNCKCKIEDKHFSKKGIAYTITLEPQIRKHKKRKKQQIYLDEIKVPNHTQKHSTSSSNDSHNKENSTKTQKQKHNHQKKSEKQTLQDYLYSNKPTFIASAEERRKCLIDLAYMREQRCMKYKELLGAITDLSFKHDIPLQNIIVNNQEFDSKHLFTGPEMKQITAKNYKKLPEVQQKLTDHREKQVKKANKLLTDIFNHKLRQQALKGKLTIPTTTSVIRLS